MTLFVYLSLGMFTIVSGILFIHHGTLNPWSQKNNYLVKSIYQSTVSLTVEVDRTNVAEQLLPIDVAGHARAEAWVAVA